MVSNGSGSNDSTDWCSSSGDEMPQDADEGEAGPSNRRGSTQSSDSPGGGWATTGAVRSTTYFSMSNRNSGCRNDNNHASSTNPDPEDTPMGRHGRRRPPNMGRGGPKDHGGSGSRRITRSEGKAEIKNQDDTTNLDDGQPLERQSTSLHNIGLDDVSHPSDKWNGGKGRESGRSRRTRTLDKTKTASQHPTETGAIQMSPGVHGFLVGGIAGSTHHHTLHNTEAPGRHPMSAMASFASHFRAKNGVHGAHYAQPGHSGPYMHGQPWQAQASSYSRHTRSQTVPDANYEGGQQQITRYQHQYHHSDPSPDIGWPPSGGSMGHNNVSHGITTGSVPFSQVGMTETSTVPSDGAGGMDYSLQATYSMASEGFAGTTSSNSLGTLPPSAHGFESMPSHFVYEHPAHPCAGPTASFAPGSAPPLPPLMVSNLPPDFVSASSGPNIRQIDSDSTSSSWTMSSSLPSSVSSSTRHACTTIDDKEVLK
jgi:hypothetical protein